MPHIWIFFAAACVFRAWTLILSARHERALKRGGAREFGRGNSMLLALAHTVFYLSALAEGVARRAPLDALAISGIVLYGMGAAVMVYAMHLLGRFWTVKLILAPDHQLQTHPLFERVRHPNYFLGIVPELVGFALAFHAWWTLGLGLLLYAFPLSARIHEEERVMRERFSTY